MDEHSDTHASNVASGNNTRATNKGSANVGDDGTVQVGHDHDVELARTGNKLHGSVIDNHVVELDTHGLVVLGDAAESVEEETITKLHDVGLVHASNFLQMDQHAA